MDGTTRSGLVALRLILGLVGVSQASLARDLGCSRQWVHDVLTGRVRPSPAFVQGVSRTLADRLAITPSDVHEIVFPGFPELPADLDDELPATVALRWAKAGG